MKILCVSDQIDSLIYSPDAKKNFPNVDFILCAGDLPWEYIDYIESVFNKTVYFVLGNHDTRDYNRFHKSFFQPRLSQGSSNYVGFKSIVSSRFMVEDKNGLKTPLIITGVSGSILYNGGKLQYTESEMKRRLFWMTPALIRNKILYGKYTDIFLTHSPPRKIHDKEDPCHIGFECFNSFLKRFKPKLMVHGHVHIYDQRDERRGKYYDTEVVNAYSHYIFQFP